MVLCSNSIRRNFVRIVIAFCVVVRLLFCCTVLALVRGNRPQLLIRTIPASLSRHSQTLVCVGRQVLPESPRLKSLRSAAAPNKRKHATFYTLSAIQPKLFLRSILRLAALRPITPSRWHLSSSRAFPLRSKADAPR